MKIAVLSDIHDHLEALSRVLESLRPLDPDALILCGDLTRAKVLEACAAPGWPLHFCLGNCDSPHEPELRRAARAAGYAAHGRLGTLSLPQGSLAFTHYPAEADAQARSGLYRAVFYGHTHRPGALHLDSPSGSCLLANPGDVQGRYGRVGGLVWDSENGEVEWVEG